MLRFVLVLPALAIVSVAAAGHVRSLGAPKANLVKVDGERRAGAPSTTLQRQRDGLYYVNARVNDVPVRFIVDTGSSVVVLNAADTRRVGLANSEGTRVRVETAGGPSTMRLARIDSVGIAGQSLRDVEAAVMGTGLETSLLGQNVLSELDSVRIERGTLRLN